MSFMDFVFSCANFCKKGKNSHAKSNLLRFIDKIQRETLKLDNLKEGNLSKVGSAVSVF